MPRAKRSFHSPPYAKSESSSSTNRSRSRHLRRPAKLQGHLKIWCISEPLDGDEEWVALPFPGPSETIQDLLNTLSQRENRKFHELRTKERNCRFYAYDNASTILMAEPELVAVYETKQRNLEIKSESKSPCPQSMSPCKFEEYSYYYSESDAESHCRSTGRPGQHNQQQVTSGYSNLTRSRSLSDRLRPRPVQPLRPVSKSPRHASPEARRREQPSSCRPRPPGSPAPRAPSKRPVSPAVSPARCASPLAHIASRRPVSPLVRAQRCRDRSSSSRSSAKVRTSRLGANSIHNEVITAMPPSLRGKPLEFFWIRCENKWSPCVVHVKDRPIAELCQWHAQHLFNDAGAPELVDVSQEAHMQRTLKIALNDARSKHKDDSILDFFTCARVNGTVAVALGATKKARQQAVKVAYSAFAILNGGIRMPEWATDGFTRLVDAAKEALKSVTAEHHNHLVGNRPAGPATARGSIAQSLRRQHLVQRSLPSPAASRSHQAVFIAADICRGILADRWRAESSKLAKRGALQEAPSEALCNFEFPLLEKWLSRRDLFDVLRRSKRAKSTPLPSLRYEFKPKHPVVHPASDWQVAFHGTVWYALWSILEHGVVCESHDLLAGPDSLCPGVYCSPKMEAARQYAKPQILFNDGIYHRALLEVYVDRSRQKQVHVDRSRQKKEQQMDGTQWVFPGEAVSIVAVHVLPNDPPSNGEDRFDHWVQDLEALPKGRAPPPMLQAIDSSPPLQADFALEWTPRAKRSRVTSESNLLRTPSLNATIAWKRRTRLGYLGIMFSCYRGTALTA